MKSTLWYYGYVDYKKYFKMKGRERHLPDSRLQTLLEQKDLDESRWNRSFHQDLSAPAMSTDMSGCRCLPFILKYFYYFTFPGFSFMLIIMWIRIFLSKSQMSPYCLVWFGPRISRMGVNHLQHNLSQALKSQLPTSNQPCNL